MHIMRVNKSCCDKTYLFMGIFLKKMKKKIDSAQHLRALDYLEWLRLPIYFALTSSILLIWCSFHVAIYLLGSIIDNSNKPDSG